MVIFLRDKRAFHGLYMSRTNVPQNEKKGYEGSQEWSKNQLHLQERGVQCTEPRQCKLNLTKILWPVFSLKPVLKT